MVHAMVAFIYESVEGLLFKVKPLKNKPMVFSFLEGWMFSCVQEVKKTCYKKWAELRE